MSVCMSLCHVFAYFVGKIILAGWENEDENEDGDDDGDGDGGKLRMLTTKPMIRLFDFPPNSPSLFLLDIHLYVYHLYIPIHIYIKDIQRKFSVFKDLSVLCY